MGKNQKKSTKMKCREFIAEEIKKKIIILILPISQKKNSDGTRMLLKQLFYES
jgi:hypothetical protein